MTSITSVSSTPTYSPPPAAATAAPAAAVEAPAPAPAATSNDTAPQHSAYNSVATSNASTIIGTAVNVIA